MSWRDLRWDEVEIIYRAYNALRNADIATLGQVEDMTDRELLLQHGIGKGTLYEIREMVDKMRRRWHRGL